MKPRKRIDVFAGEEDPEFQMAPMIDVVFQLLIFFMCVTSLQTVRISKKIDLPFADKSTKPQEGEGTAIINLEWQGAESNPKVSINGVDKSLQDAVIFLKEIRARNPDVRVMMRADHRVRYHQVYDAMDACSKAGIIKIAFVTLQSEAKKPLTP